MNPFSLENETALITGGGTGLGFGIAQCLVRAGARVVLVGRREAVLVEACVELGELATFVVGDITVTAGATDLIAKAEATSGSPLTILCNNAGIHAKKLAVDTSPEEFSAVMQTHVVAAHALTRAVLPGMLERKHGNILFTASMASFLGIPMVMAYSAAKTAMLGMVRSLSAEVSAGGVRVNAIAPGWVDTPMTRKALAGDQARIDKILGRTPMGRFGDPDDIGNAAVYLCSPAAKFITGVVLPVDGGASIGF